MLLSCGVALFITPAQAQAPGAAVRLGPVRLGIAAFGGPAALASAAERELTAAFTAQPGLTVVPSAALAARIRDETGDGPLGWTSKPADIKRILDALGLDLVATGKVVREGRRKLLLLTVRTRKAGGVAAAVRVERPAEGFAALAPRIVGRLTSMSLASLGVVAPSAVAAADPAPAVEPVPAIEPVEEPELTSDPAVVIEEPPVVEPPAAGLPRKLRPAQGEPRKPPLRGDVPGASLPVLEARLGLGGSKLSHGPVSTSGATLELGLTLFPASSVASVWRSFGIDIGLTTKLYLDGADLSFLQVRPSAIYRFFVGDHSVDAHVGYEFRKLESAGLPGSDSIVSVGVTGTFRLGELWRVSPAIRGLYVVSTGHSGGVALGFSAWAQLGSLALGIYYRGELVYAQSGVAGSVDDSVHTAGLFTRYRF